MALITLYTLYKVSCQDLLTNISLCSHTVFDILNNNSLAVKMQSSIVAEWLAIL